MSNIRADRARQWKTFRRKNFLTQEKLAEILGIGKSTVNCIEQKKRDPHLSTLHKFDVLKRRYDSERQFSGVDWRAERPSVD